MEEIYRDLMGPQFYVISQDHYIDLRNSESMLMQMAHEVFNDTHRENGDQKIVLSRAEINYFFAGIGELIGRALDGVGRDNGILPWNKVWQ